MNYAEEGLSPRRLASIAFVALLHIVILYILLSTLGSQVIQVLRQPMEIKIIQQAAPPPPAPPPPPPPPQFVAPPLPYIPPPLLQIAQPPPAAPVIAAVTTVKPPAPPPPPAPAITRSAGLDTNQTCTPPDYPEEAEEMGQTGRTVVEFLIDTTGAVVSARIASSSGHTSLDDAAEQALSQCKFRPALGADGKPQESWAIIPYDWTLN